MTFRAGRGLFRPKKDRELNSPEESITAFFTPCQTSTTKEIHLEITYAKTEPSHESSSLAEFGGAGGSVRPDVPGSDLAQSL
jgi:hypothetical protein